MVRCFGNLAAVLFEFAAHLPGLLLLGLGGADLADGVLDASIGSLEHGAGLGAGLVDDLGAALLDLVGTGL